MALFESPNKISMGLFLRTEPAAMLILLLSNSLKPLWLDSLFVIGFMIDVLVYVL
jgi:hypothetical protein